MPTLEQAERIKACLGCERKLPLTSEYFHRRARTKRGFYNRCKSCVNARNRAGYAQKPPQPRVLSRDAKLCQQRFSILSYSKVTSI